MSLSNPVVQTSRPFVFSVRRFAVCQTEEQAREAARKLEGFLMTEKVSEDRIHVVHAAVLDVRAAIPDAEQKAWSGPKEQYALYRALVSLYGVHDEVADHKYYHYHFGAHATIEEAKTEIPLVGEIIEWMPQKDVFHTNVKYRKTVDLLAEAKPFLRMLEVSYSDLIPEEIPPYTVRGPTHVQRAINIEGVVTPGELAFMNYSLRDRPGRGASIHFMRPAAADGLDHDFLRHFVLIRGVKIIQRNGQTIVSSDDGKVFLWKAGPQNYYYVAGGYPEVLDAYLAKFPSVLPATFTFDKAKWMREEVRRTFGRLRTLAAEDPYDHYLSDYFYLCRFIEPVPGAPAVWPSFLGSHKLTAQERRAHYSRVDSWWKAHELDFALRANAPLSHQQMMSLSPTDLPATRRALEEIRAATRPEDAPMSETAPHGHAESAGAAPRPR